MIGTSKLLVVAAAALCATALLEEEVVVMMYIHLTEVLLIDHKDRETLDEPYSIVKGHFLQYNFQLNHFDMYIHKNY